MKERKISLLMRDLFQSAHSARYWCIHCKWREHSKRASGAPNATDGQWPFEGAEFLKIIFPKAAEFIMDNRKDNMNSREETMKTKKGHSKKK